ncbi:hypothetical protein QBC43DRAFT_291737 [Cladorrhinum sp. PSN259]|nr:hypothetical protein QBC43DRAFT_291737 [Cladorrhinum sp. PSN259]
MERFDIAGGPVWQSRGQSSSTGSANLENTILPRIIDVYVPIEVYDGSYTIRVHPCGPESTPSVVVREQAHMQGTLPQSNFEIPPQSHSSPFSYARLSSGLPATTSQNTTVPNQEAAIKPERERREPSVISLTSSEDNAVSIKPERERREPSVISLTSNEDSVMSIKIDLGASKEPSSTSYQLSATATEPPISAPQSTTVCANCKRTGHTIAQCIKANRKGNIPGCPICNVTDHIVDDCPTNPTEEELWEILVINRARKPPIKTKRYSWVELCRRVKRLSDGSYPWSRKFTITRAKSLPDFWKTYHYDMSSSEVEFPVDPQTRTWDRILKWERKKKSNIERQERKRRLRNIKAIKQEEGRII